MHTHNATPPPLLRHFDAFINLINALNSVDWSSLSTLHKQPLLRHTASLREHVVRAMSNMLTANIDSGLTHAISESMWGVITAELYGGGNSSYVGGLVCSVSILYLSSCRHVRHAIVRTLQCDLVLL